MIKIQFRTLDPENPEDKTIIDYLDDKKNNHREWAINDKTGRSVRARIDSIYSGKCCYCEAVEGNTIDHFEPKKPDGHVNWDACWNWENFILACSICNTNKGEKPIEVEGIRIVDPRDDDPYCFLAFDYKTGSVSARGIPGSNRFDRGDITVKRFHLDSRDKLNDVRRQKLLDVFHYIKDTVDYHEVDRRRSDNAWSCLCTHLAPNMPYLGIVRQMLLDSNSGIRDLLDRLRHIHPEFDDLVGMWCFPEDCNNVDN